MAVSLVFGPRFVSAQTVADLQTQIQALLQEITALQAQVNSQGLVSGPTPASTNAAAGNSNSNSGSGQECLKLKYSLYFGSTDATTNGEVSKLQKFLQWTTDYEYPTITGFYGPATEAAVKRFQTKYNIVTSGSPDTTGWGAVGPKTKKVIEELSCKGTTPGGSPSLTITSPNAGGVWIKGFEYQVYWTKTSLSSSKELTLTLVRADNGNEVILKKGVDNDLKATVKVPTDIQTGSYYLKIAGVVDGVVVSDMSDQPLSIQDPTPGDGIFTASPLTVLSGGTVTFQFAWTGADVVRLYLDCPSGITAKALQPEKEPVTCNTFTNYLSPSSAALQVVFTSTATGEKNVKAILYGYLITSLPGSTATEYKTLGTKDLTIKVLPPFTSLFTITSPNGGETWEQGTTQTVTWEKVNISSQKDAKLFLESTSGTQYVLKTGVENDLKASVTVPKDILVGSYKVVIQATVNGVIVKDASDAYLNVVAPNTVKSITVLSPNGGEKWEIGKTYTIKWNFTGSVPLVNVLLQKDDACSGDVCVPALIIAEKISNGGSYAWVVSAAVGDVYRIVIQDSASPAFADQSDTVFSIVKAPSTTPSITVVSPNGGELYEYGKNFTVTWTSANIPAGQTVTVVADNVTTGVTGYTLAYQTANDGTQSVSLPSVAPAGTYKVRIYTTVNNATVTDSSDASFTITQDPSTVQTFTVLTPNGGELWVKGTNVYPTWTDQNIGSDKKVDLYLKNVADNKEYPFALSVYNDGKTIDPKVGAEVPAGSYKFVIRATLDGKAVSDESDAAFTLQEKVAFTSFKATDPTLNSSNSITFSWQATYPVTGLLKIYCTEGAITFTVPETGKAPYCNSIIANYNDAAKSSDSFTLVPTGNTGSVSVEFAFEAYQGNYAYIPPVQKTTVVFPPTKQGVTLNLVSPNGGETFEYGKSFDVTWSSTNLTSSQLVTVVADNVTTGVSGYTLAYQTGNDGKQSVSLPSVAPAGTYKVRIYTTLGSATYTDTSDGTINITQAASLTLITPKGGESWVKGSSYSVTWSDINVASTKSVDLYFVNAAGEKFVLNKGIENDGAGTPQVSASVSAGSYYIQIEAVVDGYVISDKSDGMVTVSEKATSANDNAAQLAALIATLQGLVAELQALIGSQ